ncbi:hypothetical protein CHUAL_001557 [Chamberlinius hualienensis]
MVRFIQRNYSMESANHEFTWLSGRAHPTVARSSSANSTSSEEAVAGDLTKKVRKSQNSQLVAATPKNADQSSTSTPVPRIFARGDQSKSPPVYDVPPQLEKSVFYIATPKELSIETKRTEDSKETEISEELKETERTRTLNEPPTSLTSSIASAPVDKSIILEFDPILQRRQEENDRRLSALRLSTLSFTNPTSEIPTLPLQSEEVTDKCNVYQGIPPNDFGESSRRYEPVDQSVIYDFPKKPNVTRSLSNGSSNSSIKMSSSTTSSSPSSTTSRDGFHRFETYSDATSGRSTPNSVHLTKTRASPSPPVPKPRSKLHINTTCSLSSVPPPPPSAVYKTGPTHEEAPGITVKINRGSAFVDNSLYMMCENGSVMSSLYADGKINKYSSEESDSSILDETGYDPPAFPPPPPPPDYNEVVSSDNQVLSSNVNHPESDKVKPIPVARNRVKPPPKPPRTLQSSNSIVNEVTKNKCCTPTEPKFKHHVYDNIMGLCAQQGVYGKINKFVGANSSAENPPDPPPLPPRGQQQRGGPNFKTLAQMLAKRTSYSLDASGYITKDIVQSNRESRNVETSRSTNDGMLYRIGKGKKDITQKWVVLERGHLQCYSDDKTDSPQEIFHKTDIVSVAKGLDVKHSNLDLKCFELVTITNKERSQVFGARYLSERELWMKHLVQSLSLQSAVPISTSGVTKAGYVLLRKSVTGCFQACWLVLHSRQLDVNYEDYKDSFSLDLRKVISMQEFDQDPQMGVTMDDGAVFVIHYPALTLYIRTTIPFDTHNWYQRILQVTKEGGNGLEDQQLTHEDVPVIVEKCIKFVGTYGLTTKGIYREGATNSRISKILDCFYKDAQKSDLKTEDHTEHEVANVLKRFFRTLPDPLLTKQLHPGWMAAVEESSLESYKSLLAQLPKTNYQTLKKLMAHLRSVAEHSDQNMMHAANLAQVFGSTLLSNEKDMDLNKAAFEIEVMVQLINNYFTLFGVSSEEIEKEEMIQRALKDLRDARIEQKPAGDILVGIYIYNRLKCINVKLSPAITAYDLCKYACQQARLRERPENMAVFEVVCDGDLERPLHYSEIVLAVTLRWATWADSDAKENYLVIKNNDILHRILPLTRQPLSTFGELKFATAKSKTFKKLLFEFKNARLAYYKDAKIALPLESWNIEDIAWYIGAESKRPAPWCITFIENKTVVKRGSKEAPYFGRAICFAGEDEFNKWVASMIIGQYPGGILPKVEYFDLLT